MICTQEQWQKLIQDQLAEDPGVFSRYARLLCEDLQTRVPEETRYLILAGSGWRGQLARACQEQLGPAAVLMDCTHLEDRDLAVFSQQLSQADVILEALGEENGTSLSDRQRRLMRALNQSQARICSLDLNAGAFADRPEHDPDAVHSELTYAIGALRPFHALRRLHGLFDQVQLLEVSPPRLSSPFTEMDAQRFLDLYPRKRETDYKNSYGKTLIIGGSPGMAGALCFNLLGAKTAGAPYILCALMREIYPVAAGRFLSPVYHLLDGENHVEEIRSLLSQCRAVCFGSGVGQMPYRQRILDELIQESRVPIVFDAEALRLLQNNTYLLQFAQAPVILTPHLGEFTAISRRTARQIQQNPLQAARQFAAENRVVLVLKGPHTIVASPKGQIYINQTGNAGLGQAGSGDLLTGMITAMNCFADPYTASVMAVWLHGQLADLAAQQHSLWQLNLEEYPALMDAFLRRHGR